MTPSVPAQSSGSEVATTTSSGAVSKKMDIHSSKEKLPDAQGTMGEAAGDVTTTAHKSQGSSAVKPAKKSKPKPRELPLDKFLKPRERN